MHIAQTAVEDGLETLEKRGGDDDFIYLVKLARLLATADGISKTTAVVKIMCSIRIYQLSFLVQSG